MFLSFVLLSSSSALRSGMKFHRCLCSISTRQLELFLWKARPKSPTKLQDSTIFFIQLNNVYKKISEINSCHLMLLPLPWGGTLPLTQRSHLRKILRGKHWDVGLAVQTNSYHCLVLILHRQLGTISLVLERAMAQKHNKLQNFI